jgi:hypothetical protein
VVNEQLRIHCYFGGHYFLLSVSIYMCVCVVLFPWIKAVSTTRVVTGSPTDLHVHIDPYLHGKLDIYPTLDPQCPL